MVEQPSQIGARALKRQETLRRITDAGICLFIEHGFEGTTIDAIARAAGISRRTFFHYFESKDDVLLSLQSDLGGQIADRVRAAPPEMSPFAAVRDAVLAICTAIPTDDMLAIDRLMRGTPSVQARKQASYVQHEQTLFAALRTRWPDPVRETRLRLVAMVAIGAVRLAFDTFNEEGGARPVEPILRGAFDSLEAELAGGRS